MLIEIINKNKPRQMAGVCMILFSNRTLSLLWRMHLCADMFDNLFCMIS